MKFQSKLSFKTTKLINYVSGIGIVRKRMDVSGKGETSGGQAERRQRPVPHRYLFFPRKNKIKPQKQN